ncbi:MAG TPA: mechanosensitive ion channel family protein [Planctomycetota bacterium]|nr:mechanosensitive ion channel family protein [Planctomycetota bacterium]
MIPHLTQQDGAPAQGVPERRSFLETLLDIDTWTVKLVDWLPKLGNAVLVIAVFWTAYHVSRRPVALFLRRARLQEALVKLLVDQLFRWIVFGFALIMAAAQLGIDITAAIAGVGVAGLAVGFAAQDSLANVIAGLVIFWDKPFMVGDWITSKDHHGKVAEINMRTTRIRTRQNTYVIVPNKEIVSTVVINHSLYGDVRVDIPIGIAYKEDVREARRVILDAVGSIDLIEKDRSEVVMAALGSSSVDLSLRVWVEDATHEKRAHFRCLEAAKLALDEAGIEIPYPHLQLFLETLRPPAIDALREALAAQGPRD